MLAGYKQWFWQPGVFHGTYLPWIVGLLLMAMPLSPAPAEDWPTYGHDTSRSQVTQEKLPLPLQESWVYQAKYAPQPAWGDPKAEPVEDIRELRRVHFDDVFQVAAVGGNVFFGSSADGKIHCLDLATGKTHWTVITGGPIRLAPTVAQGRVYVGSDDGHVYCLRAADGSLEWKFRAAPEDRRVLGHGKMISLWPVRTGVLVDGDVAYFGAGIFPSEGVFLYAVDAGTGRLLWRNDHTGEDPQSEISPQGYLLATGQTLFAPMGRVSPAAFDRQTGKFLEQTYFGQDVGGTYALLAGDRLFTGTEHLLSYQGKAPKTGDRFVIFDGRKIVVRQEIAYAATDRQLAAIDLQRYPPLSTKLGSILSSQTSAQNREVMLLYQSREVQEELAQLQDTLGRGQAELARAAPGEQAALRARIETAKEEIVALEKKRKDLQESLVQNQKRLNQAAGDVQIARGLLQKGQRWQTASRCDQALILAGNTLFAGGQGEVIAVEADTGTRAWRARVEGTAKGLAVAQGRLLVSTDRGRIYAFGPGGTPQHGTITEASIPPSLSGPSAATIAAQAEAILKESGQRRGFCLMLGCETGQLAVELARRSELMIYVVSAEAAKAAAARRTVEAAGLYGARIGVEQWPLEKVPYAPYFANLVVTEAGPSSSPWSSQVLAEAWRMLKPQGGVALLPRAAREGNPLPPSARGEVVALFSAAGWTKIVRGPLPGSGNWTHQYANPGNTTCSDDRFLKCPLSILWFGLPGPANMVNRHERAAGPLSLDGRVFCQGDNIVMAFDAYNGVRLWERPIPGARRVDVSENAGNLAVCREGLLLAVNDQCLRLDLETGRTLATYDLPPGQGIARWGYLACDGTRIYGTRSERVTRGSLTRVRMQQTGATTVFALDLKSGKTLWTHTGQWISHNTISQGDGRLYLVDEGVTFQQRAAILEQRRRQIAQLPRAEQAAAERALAKADPRVVVALDAATGKELWRLSLETSFAAGGNLASMCQDGLLILFGIYSDGHYWKEFFAGEYSHRGVVVLEGATGRRLWSKGLGYRVRPLVIGDTLHAEPWAFDLRTGEPRLRVNPITGQTEPWQFARPGHHCGCPAGSPNGLFFRSQCLGYYDLRGDFGTQHFSGQRPGCWINFLPAAGLLIMPEASVGCMCPFPNMTTVVLAPAEKVAAWGCYSASGVNTPVRRLALNFGAPGDRQDAAGNLWLGVPRPGGSLVLPLDVYPVLYAGGSYVLRNSAHTPMAGTSDPWLFTSAARGFARCAIPLVGPGDGAARYRLRLAFADPDNDQPGQRVFQIQLQGKVVCSSCDIVKETGGRDRALVKEFTGIEVRDDLVIELVSPVAEPKPQEMPILQGLEIVREQVASLGFYAGKIELNHRQLHQGADLVVSNHREEPFEGFLELEPPRGLSVSPVRAPLKLAGGIRSRIPIDVVAASGLPEGRHTIGVKLVRADGQVDSRSSMAVEHLGWRARFVVPASEDSYVSKRYPALYKGRAEVLLVDGGQREMGDLDHALAFLKFRPQIPGKVVRVVLRLHNAGTPSGEAGRVRLVAEPWNEGRITYGNRPQLGSVVAKLGRVREYQTVECPLDVDLTGRNELSLAIEPISLERSDYFSRETGKPPELIVEYEIPRSNRGL